MLKKRTLTFGSYLSSLGNIFRLKQMQPKYRYLYYSLTGIFLTVVLSAWFVKPRSNGMSPSSMQFPSIQLYEYASRIRIHNISDPPCNQTRNIYVCSGICPWPNIKDNTLVACAFLERKINKDFLRENVYCTPDADSCPTYNAWTKDSLQQTRKHVKKIPDHMLSNFTLNSTVRVSFTQQDFRSEDLLPSNWTVELITHIRNQVRARVAFGSYNNEAIYPALDKYAKLAIINKRCAVIGSEVPWIEAALLEYNASSVTTIEYASIHSNVPRLSITNPIDFAKQQQDPTIKRKLFDSLWSYSSIEHDGLGRYRDPLNPYGDLQTMAKLTCVLKPGGLFFLAVPLSTNDFIQFNLHRIYGPIRLPLLYRYFHVVELLGIGSQSRWSDFGFQPFVVLQNKIGCKSS